MKNYNKIIVCSPNSITGGPELLHQLVDTLRSFNHNAFICYFPFGEEFKCPEPYKIYNCPQIKIEDSSDNLIILPETATWLVKYIKLSKVSIWWLSVDNYFHWERKSYVTDFVRTYKTLIKWRLPLSKLKKYNHYTQSFYAKQFLQKNDIQPEMLTDYIGKYHLSPRVDIESKKNIITYNPNKGIKKTTTLIKIYSGFDFIPIENKNASEVNQLLRSAKIYIDFGHHPGKDRLPREAALAGCCIITGQCGSAQFNQDIPIPDNYKLNDKTRDYVSSFGKIANDIFNNFSEHHRKFDFYRSKILSEPHEFNKQVINIFNSND